MESRARRDDAIRHHAVDGPDPPTSGNHPSGLQMNGGRPMTGCPMTFRQVTFRLMTFRLMTGCPMTVRSNDQQADLPMIALRRPNHRIRYAMSNSVGNLHGGHFQTGA